jgi:hypothetical protein
MLSERSGISEHTISRIEHGAPLRPTTARRLADALDVEIADLMESPPVLLGKADAPTSGPARAAEEVARDAAERAHQLTQDAPRRMQEVAERMARGAVGQGVSSSSEAPQEPFASSEAPALLAYFLAAGFVSEDDLEEAREALRRRHASRT